MRNTLFFAAAVILMLPLAAYADYNDLFAKIEAEFRLPPGILAKVANVESGGDRYAQADSSSAAGMFQWLLGSWRDTSYAFNRATNPDPAKWHPFKPIERFSVEKSAWVTGYSFGQIRGQLNNLIQHAGMDMSVGIYMGHFMGIGGARQFMIAYIRNPNSIGASLFPKQARANPGVFRERSCGGYCTLAEIYNNFARRMNVAGTRVNIAGNPPSAAFSMRGLPSSSESFSNEEPFTTVDPERDFPQYSESEVHDIETPPFPSQSFPQSPQTSEPAPNTQTPASNTVTKKAVPGAAHLIAYPKQQGRNKSVVVFWSSVGMKDNGCSVTAGGDAFAAGNVGEKRFAISSYDSGDITFELRCTPQTGSVVVKTTSVRVE
jgi:hypothetical protein